MMLPARARLLLLFALTLNVFLMWRCSMASDPLLIDRNSICQKSAPPGGLYTRLCLTQPEIAQEAARGIQLGRRECQHQFRHRRWNCTSHSKSLARILQQDIRETAFINSISAAGVLYAVTQACSQGELLQCGCVTLNSASERRDDGKTKRDVQLPAHGDQRWEWAGCGDDIDFGQDVSRRFMDYRKRKGKSDVRTLIDLHNKEAGRLAVKTHMRTECKCHGLSGSCTLRSCWRKMPLFRHVGNHLMQGFHAAVRVMGGNDGKSLVALDPDVPPPDAHSLIYSDESPDFCVANRRAGSEGTQGRVCNSTEAGPGSCDWLCCGRGHADHTLVYVENCHCHFQWCCVVQCQTCTMRIDVDVCL